MDNRYDIVIIGGGPAGISAAITARARNKDVLIVSNPARENPLASSKHVDNYPGMPEASGLHLLETMAAHAQKAGVHFMQARAISIVPTQSTDDAGKTQTLFSVTTSSDYVEGRVVIIACGASSGGKAIEGEKEYLGRGVSYCATCDGMLYRAATVLVAGLSPEAVDEANFLAEIGATVHFVSKKDSPGLDKRIIPHTGKLLAIEGDALGVTHVKLSERPPRSPQVSESEPERTQSLLDQPKEIELKVNGVFLLRPGIAPTSLLSSLELEEGFIKVDRGMHTSQEGVFAAGDCAGKPLQVAKAVGEGQVAVLSAVEYLAN